MDMRGEEKSSASAKAKRDGLITSNPNPSSRTLKHTTHIKEAVYKTTLISMISTIMFNIKVTYSAISELFLSCFCVVFKL